MTTEEKKQRMRVYTLTKTALRIGWLVKSTKCQKKRCRNKFSIQCHHPDYSKPLEVIWLCFIHHKEIHDTPEARERSRKTATDYWEKMARLSQY